MSAHDSALKLALLKLLSTQVKATRETLAGEVVAEWKAKDRNAAVLPGGTTIGTVTLASGSTKAGVSDEDEFMAWVLETHPEEIEQVKVTRVKPGFAERILAHARRAGEPIDPETGEIVPGVTVKDGDPYPLVRLESDAAQLVSAAWQSDEDGILRELLGGLVQPAIEGGETE